MMTIFLIGLGGFLGAVARFLLMSAFSSFGIGFFLGPSVAVNTLGCFLAGSLYPFFSVSSFFLKPFVLLGFLGAFTTFSAFTTELFAAGLESNWSFVFLHFIFSQLFSFIGFFLGYQLSKLLFTF